MAQPFPYIGCKISLVSKHGIRYEGTLYSIKAEDHTICLSSEGRNASKNLQEVPSAPDVFEYIQFRGSDIQDLTVCETSEEPQAPPDPAIVSTGPIPAPAQPAPVVSVPAPHPASQAGGLPAPAPAAQQSNARRNQRNPGGTTSLEGTGAHAMSRRAKPADNPFVLSKDEFDFAKGNDIFDKSQLSSEFEDKLSLDTEVDAGQFYNKTSFFDNISCDSLDRERGEGGKGKKFAEQRKLDMETFGETFGRNHFRRGKGNRGPRQDGGKGGSGEGGGKGGRRRGGRNRNRNRGNNQGGGQGGGGNN